MTMQLNSFESKLDARKKGFKKNVDNEESRRRREDEAIQIRKSEKVT